MARTVICTYRVRPGSEEAFRGLLERHWPLLRRLDLVTEEAPQHFSGEEDGRPLVVEIFTWQEGAWNVAHERPEVEALWGEMGTLVEERGDRPKWAFGHFDRLELAGETA